MIPAEHPCLSAQAHFRYGRIHLPVAPRCNIRCGYCDRRYDCANESRPGVTSEVISPEAALDRVERALRLDSRLRVAGVAGPGEPLANPATLETLRLVRSRFPGLLLCLSTNGLVLSDALPEPVSYTHLDVYKRQQQQRCQSRFHVTTPFGHSEKSSG